MFSTVTTALSTNMPSARTNENKTTIFSVMPSAARMAKLISIDSGIAIATKSALRRPPMKKSRSTTTSIRPVKMLFSSSVS